MMSEGLRYRPYRWRGGDEWLAEIGNGPPILIAPPLFEELNRCRAFIIAIMHDLADAGFQAVLADLPGTGESPRDLLDVTWNDWSGALGMLAFDTKVRSQLPLLISLRGGCLVEDQMEVAARWRFAPTPGAALTRDLVRARQAILPDKVRAEIVVAEARTTACEFAGYVLPPHMFADLHDAQPVQAEQTRTVRLTSDPAPADLKVDGRPLWRQAEPGTDPDLSADLAADIVSWARACAG